MEQLLFEPNQKVVVLTGAGISAESGLKTFRASDGLWENHRVEDVANVDSFAKDPFLVWRFYKERLHQAQQATPNQGHLALAKLQQKLGNNFTLITQNVDGLHQKAGNTDVLEMHGSLYSAFCVACQHKVTTTNLDLNKPIPSCPVCGKKMRPNIVWFGEIPYYLNQIQYILQECHYLIIAGTSGVVYPAAQFAAVAHSFGATTICVNLDAPANYGYMDVFYQGTCGQLLPQLVDEWTAKLC